MTIEHLCDAKAYQPTIFQTHLQEIRVLVVCECCKGYLMSHE